jgi:HK97 family phage prohead protease
MSGVKYFQHQHDDGKIVASTKNGLTLFADDIGVAFKLYLPPTLLGMETRNLLRDNAKQAMSARFTVLEFDKHSVDDVEIVVVLKADLLEVSLVEHGANDDAFAVLVEDNADWVTDMCRSTRMTDEMNRSHIRRAIRRLESLAA